MSSASRSKNPPGRGGYRYLADDRYFNPVVEAQKRSSKDTKEILLDASNFRPREGQSWRSIRQLLDDYQDGDTKIFFIARHGHSEHNKSQEVFGIDCFNAVRELNQAFHDPGLTTAGQDQARNLGQHLRKVLLDDLGIEPRGVGFYSSSLHRCISTAEIAACAVSQGNTNADNRTTQGTSHVPVRPAVVVLDELREWLGWDHNIQTDRRGSKTDIKQAFYYSGVDLRFKNDFSEEDVVFQGEPIRETWVNVRRRWERALDWIFESDERKHICLFGNNRSLQCALHALGLPLDTGLVEEYKKITVVNLANCAVLALVVRRQPLSPAEAHEKELEWNDLERKEQDVIAALRMKEQAALQPKRI